MAAKKAKRSSTADMASRWEMVSKSNAAWNESGLCHGLLGGAASMYEAVETKKKKLGDPPGDLEYKVSTKGK